MTRQRGTMDMNLFRKIVEDAKTVPAIDHFTITGLGEPLLDKHLMERVRTVRKAMPGAILDLYTNGTYLDEKKSEELRDAGLSVLYISLNAVNKEKRKQIMKVDDFNRVRAAAHRAIEIGGKKMRVLVKAVCSKDLMEHQDNEQFLAEWNGPYQQGGNAFLHMEGNWAGAVWPMRVSPTTACDRALGQIMVLWDGRVSLCCFDGEGEVILGDLNRQTIREVFNGPLATGIREAHFGGRRGELKLCSSCTAI
jgi:hypothetical protein